MKDDGYEVRGMLNAKKLSAAGYTGSQTVTVAADGTTVRLDTGTSSYSAGLDPAQARYLARSLYRMARLVEQRLSAASPSPVQAQEQ